MTKPHFLAGGKPASANDFILERRERVVRAAMPCEGDVLLDFGCGNGEQTVHFLDGFALTLGADVNGDYLRGALQRRSESPGSSSMAVVQYDGLTLPLADESVDAAISFEVLEHVEDETRALAEIHRTLRPGGWLAMSVPNRWWVFETHGADLPLLPWNRVPFFSWLPKSFHDRWARARIYRRREIVAKLRAQGFEVRQSAYITAPMDVLKFEPLRDLLRATLFRADLTPIPFLATAVLVVATKAGGEGSRGHSTFDGGR